MQFSYASYVLLPVLRQVSVSKPIQFTYLAPWHFCLTKTRPDTLPATLFKTFNK